MTNDCCIIGGSGAVDYVSPVDHTKRVESGAYPNFDQGYSLLAMYHNQGTGAILYAQSY